LGIEFVEFIALIELVGLNQPINHST
jgi:hypothetical protein